jgi:hypothetical protein
MTWRIQMKPKAAEQARLPTVNVRNADHNPAAGAKALGELSENGSRVI